MSDLPQTALGVHFYLDENGLDPNRDLNNGADFVKKIRCRWVNVTAATRLDLGMQFIQRLRFENPRLQIIWRAWSNSIGLSEDTDMWQTYSAQQWYDKRVKPYLGFIWATGCYVMTSNESLVIPMKAYADWHAKVIEIGHADRVKFAVGRTSTGTPPENEYRNMESMFAALATYGGVYSPNEYTNEDPNAASGNIERFKNPLALCRDVWKIAEPEVCSGEFGTAAARKNALGGYDIDAEAGYQKMGMGGKRYCNLLVNSVRSFYLPYNASALVYCWGPWKNAGFDIKDDEELQTAWVREVEAGRLDLREGNPPEIIIPPPAQPPVTPPAPEPPTVEPPPAPPPPPKPPEVPIPPAPALKTYTFPLTIEIEAFDHDTALEMARAMVQITRNGYNFAVGALVMFPLISRVKDVQISLGVSEGE